MHNNSGQEETSKARNWLAGPVLVCLLIFAVLALLAVSGCSPSASSSSPSKPSGQAAANDTGFANPDLLVETDGLAQLLNDANVRIVDARTPDQYKAGHIKGAINIPVESTFLPTGPKGVVGTPEQISDLLGSKGIANDNRIIVYDTGGDNRAPRVFWTLEYYGQKKIALLNGGFKKWQKESREVTTAEPTLTAAKFTAKADPARFDSMADMLSAIGKSGVAIVDARSPQEYSGEDVRAKRGGHIPGAVNIDWTTLFTADGTFKPASELSKIYQDRGVTKDKEVHAY